MSDQEAQRALLRLYRADLIKRLDERIETANGKATAYQYDGAEWDEDALNEEPMRCPHCGQVWEV